MKKLVALLLVCAGLTMMAGVPEVNHGILLKNPVMKRMLPGGGHSSLGISSSQMPGARICFLHLYNWQANPVEEADPFRTGGWLTNAVDGENGYLILEDGILDEVSQPIKVDYSANTVTLEVTNNEPFGTIAGDTETTTAGGNVITVETTSYYYVVNEAWLLNQGPLADVQGIILDDGTIEIADGFAYYIETVKVTTITGKGTTQVMTDTTRTATSLLRDTKLVKPNGKHEYVNESNGQTRIQDVYIRQSGDTVYVMNLYGYGWGENYMVLGEDGNVTYPGQPLRDLVDATYPDGDGVWYNMTYSGGTLTPGNVGSVTPDEITWGLTTPSDNDGRWYGWYDNRLYYTDGNTFVLPITSLRGDVNRDGAVTIGDVTTLIDHLLSSDYDESDEFSPINADANLDESISIGDVTTIIDYLLSGNWPD